MSEQQLNQFYVYAYLRSKPSQHGPKYSPFYIGKGKGDRAFVRRNRITPTPADVSFIVFVQEGLTEEEALNLEKFCINLYGRIDNQTGILRNLTDGGEGLSGFSPSSETRNKISASNKGKTKGRKLSEETKRKISSATSGKNNPRWKKEVTLETRRKMSLAKQDFQMSELAKQKMVATSAMYLYELIDANGDVYVTENLACFARQYNLTVQLLRLVVNGKQKHHKGWKARIVEKLK
jgi:hypothetical protein